MPMFLGLPYESDRPENATYAYNGLISANLRTPTGPEWDNFTEEVRLAFNDSRFNGWPMLSADQPVRSPTKNTVKLISIKWYLLIEKEISIANNLLYSQN